MWCARLASRPAPYPPLARAQPIPAPLPAGRPPARRRSPGPPRPLLCALAHLPAPDRPSRPSAPPAGHLPAGQRSAPLRSRPHPFGSRRRPGPSPWSADQPPPASQLTAPTSTPSDPQPSRRPGRAPFIYIEYILRYMRVYLFRKRTEIYPADRVIPGTRKEGRV